MQQGDRCGSPKKSYKRLRLKWLLIFLLIGFVIIRLGKWERKQEEMPEGTKNPVLERNDYIYLEESPEIRVLLQAGNYSGIYHTSIELEFPNGGYILTCEDEHWEKHSVAEKERVSIGTGGTYDFSVTQNTVLAAVAGREDDVIRVNSITRNRESCTYYGRLEIRLEDAGLTLVNVLPLETYLCGVVPSEMPASYEEEALKAQAILARTYAYKYLIEPAYPEYHAHVDDSIAFQVYGNLAHHERTSNAVADTTGILLFHEKTLAEVYYYSTSCGYGTDGKVWGGNGQTYLQAVRIGKGSLETSDGKLSGKEAEQYYLQRLTEERTFRKMIAEPFTEGYEVSEPWYRWSADVQVNAEALLKRIQERYAAKPDAVLTKCRNGAFAAKPVKELGEITDIRIEERGAGGVCSSLLIEGTKNTYRILQEYNIRYILNGNGTTVVRADGTEAVCRTLLPSGFFYLETGHFGQNVISYNIYGGGYGHGVGMSQNAANQMARLGLNCRDILTKFFEGTVFVDYENHF